MMETSDDGVYLYAGTIYITYKHKHEQKIKQVVGNPNCLHMEDVDKLPKDAFPLLRPLGMRTTLPHEYKTVAHWCFMAGLDDADKYFAQQAEKAEAWEAVEELAEKLYTVTCLDTTPWSWRTEKIKDEWRDKARRWQELGQ